MEQKLNDMRESLGDWEAEMKRSPSLPLTVSPPHSSNLASKVTVIIFAL
jgi:hypothetical protein